MESEEAIHINGPVFVVLRDELVDMQDELLDPNRRNLVSRQLREWLDTVQSV